MAMSGLILLGVVTALYAVTASRLDRWSIGAPIVFMAVGALLGPGVLDLLQVPAHGEPIKLVTEFTLALLLFADASTVVIPRSGSGVLVPVRLLVIGLPLTLGLGTLLARAVVPGVDWAMAGLIATILAPTDAALSLPVVTNRKVPMRVRRALNIESGLNDGIATPIVVLMIALVAGEEPPGQTDAPGAFRSIAIAVLVAVLVGVTAGWLVRRAKERGLTTQTSEQLAVITLAPLTYIAAVQYDGNGFVAAFVAGLCFGAVSRRTLADATEFTETTGMFMSFVVWALFGATLVGPLLTSSWHGGPILFALLALTVGRLLPVALALAGSGLQRSTTAYLGWFGPRGLASVVFLLIAAEELHLDELHDPLVETVVWTIALSVLLHGLSAGPLSHRYAHAIAQAPPGTIELAVGEEPRLRRRALSDPIAEPAVADQETP
jgi:NhaP-type Na+/H+ or K+/H+ antiporter